MSEFDTLWREISKRPGVITVQNREELEHVFNLLKRCESYLEVGTAEGNSLYVLSQALGQNSTNHIVPRVDYIDYGERHTEEPRNQILDKLAARHIYVHGWHGNSHSTEAAHVVNGYDAVLIDAGHAYEDVIGDACMYGPLAKRYIIFHDIKLPEVAAAFDWYVAQNDFKNSYKFVNSNTFGYGICEI